MQQHLDHKYIVGLKLRPCFLDDIDYSIRTGRLWTCLFGHPLPYKPVTDVAFDSGINSLSPFYRAFRKEYGITPNEFRSHAQATLHP